MAVDIKKMLVKSTQLTYPGTNPCNYVIIHETANEDTGADAKMHAVLQYNGFTASWQYTVDDKGTWQSYQDNVKCWHAGDGMGVGNTRGIGIEICVNKDGDYAKAVANAIELVKYLMAKHNISIENVWQHNRTSGYGKNCPHYLRAGTRKIDWKEFVKKAEGAKGDVVEREKEERPEKPKPYTHDATYPKLENYGSTVGKVQQMLVDVGYDIKVDKSFGPATDKAVRDFQRKHNLAVDGQAGPATQNKLKSIINKKKQKGNLVVDGSWGEKTSHALQDYFKLKIKDGIISGQIQSTSIDNIPSAKVGTGGSNLIRAMQEWLGVKVDGNLGPATIKALQHKMDTHVDGYISNPSLVVSEMQRRLNIGKL